MEKRKILIQLDTDPQASVFDRVVAVDAGAEEIYSYGQVTEEQVKEFVHGAIFTRGPKDLRNTAIFIGGYDVALGEKLVEEARKHMIPPAGLQVSILMDANGSNTTAAAAVRTAAKHLDLAKTSVIILGGTGPVGQRVARLLARTGCEVRVASRKEERASNVCDNIRRRISEAKLEPVATGNEEELDAALADRELVIAAGAAGVTLLPKAARDKCSTMKVAIDLNAFPPLGIEGIEATDKAKEQDGVICYGAIGVGGLKMKIHKAAIAALFSSNDQVMDAEEVYALAESLE